MAKITLYHDQSAAATCVPNIFIDQYMTRANGEYVKIYLYLLRCFAQPSADFSLSGLADHFDCTERDILRALKYWEKLRLFHLEYDANDNLSGIRMLNSAYSAAQVNDTADLAQQEKKISPSPVVSNRQNISTPYSKKNTAQEQSASTENVTDHFIQAATRKRPAYTLDDTRAFCEKSDVRELIFITEKYLGRTLNQNDLNMIFFWYDELHFSTELIEFLIENCVSKGHTSLHYMQRIAEDFAEHNIRTVEEARQMLNQDSSLYHTVIKAFGIRGRNLVPPEMNFLKQWSTKFGFPEELIAEACSRTIRAIHEPNFGYANSILEKWHKAGIHTMDAVAKADEVYQQQKSRPERSQQPATASQFTNFKQRNNNYQDLQQQLLQKSMSATENKPQS